MGISPIINFHRSLWLRRLVTALFIEHDIFGKFFEFSMIKDLVSLSSSISYINKRSESNYLNDAICAHNCIAKERNFSLDACHVKLRWFKFLCQDYFFFPLITVVSLFCFRRLKVLFSSDQRLNWSQRVTFTKTDKKKSRRKKSIADSFMPISVWSVPKCKTIIADNVKKRKKEEEETVLD